MTQSRIVIWSVESSLKVEEIKEFILLKWSEKEVGAFLQNLRKFESLVKQFPNLYPPSRSHPHLRKAVISRHNSVIYEIDGAYIKVHTVLDNLQDNE